jgi:hypothetical protein
MAFGEILSSISVIIASGTAIYGISAWKREFTGKRKIELAEEALTLFYEAREVITSSRSCLGFGYEGMTREPEPEETPAQKKARDAAYVIFERFQPHEELFSKLHAMRYRFMAQFGLGSAKPFDELKKIRNEIFSAARHLARLWAEDMSHFDEKIQKAYSEKIQKYESIFWDTYDGVADPINPRLDKVVSEIESICMPVIMDKGRLFMGLHKLWAKVWK